MSPAGPAAGPISLVDIKISLYLATGIAMAGQWTICWRPCVRSPSRPGCGSSCCARGELTVSELTQILGQSQPRVSRHLKLLCEAGLLDRFREGSWVFYRLNGNGRGGALARHLVALCGDDDPMIALDLQRLAAIKRQRA